MMGSMDRTPTKAKIMTKSLHRNFGVRRSKEQLREQDQYRRVKKVLLKSDVHVVEEQAPHFTIDSAQRLIQDIMYCSQDLDFIKQKIKEIELKLKNMIDVLGRIYIFKKWWHFWVTTFLCILKAKF
ncbi:hypothetical protein AB205_0155520 [Aquarana catesbeiana]|uniref:Uncharacterized protein n=1 Tax=Aquarana catesbeiana TaxID=8400 RepID=A0A2G9QAF1_AQUCT|nr:hypothetical protein AB205_0155520 [Aquarana catesbeiana]